MSAKVGCNVGGVYTNILTYADDVVMLAPLCRALQYLINMLADSASNIDMLCNTDKTVCMVFPPKDKRKVVTSTFPAYFKLDNMNLKFVTEVTLLLMMRVMIDMSREVRAMFIHTNILARRFSSCSARVKIVLFRTYCICFY